MKIAYLSPWFPFPPDNGAKTRIYNTLRYLAKDHEVTLITFSPGKPDLSGLDFCSAVHVLEQDPFDKSRLFPALRFFMPRPPVARPVDGMMRLVDEVFQKGDFSAAISFTSAMAIYLTHQPVHKLLDLDTSMTYFAIQRLRLETSATHKLRDWLSLQKTIAFERELVSRFDATVILSNESYAPLKPVLASAGKVWVIGNGVDLDYYPFQAGEADLDTLVYNGALTFGANYDAVKWFLQETFPRIRDSRPAAVIKVTGSLDGVDVGTLPNRDGVIFTGYVPDIRLEVARCWVCVVPTRRGGGQRMKILEAMALGVPVVSTSTGVGGLEIVHGEHAIVADEPGEFAKAVTWLLEERSRRDMLARNARALMEKKYSWDKVLAPFQSALDNVYPKSTHLFTGRKRLVDTKES